MSTWDYDTDRIELKGKGFDARFKSFLNNWGERGWELCGMREVNDGITCIFKKEIPDLPDELIRDIDEGK